jgi:hypothetical protein
MNEEKFCKSFTIRRETAKLKVFSPYFMSARLLNENCYQVQMEKDSFNCKTPLIHGFFILENAKFWYLNFIYNFMYKCLDMTRIHFVEGDTDSMYWAISGSKEENYEQRFKSVIKIMIFIMKIFTNTLLQVSILPTTVILLSIKKYKKLNSIKIIWTCNRKCENMIALAPKNVFMFG